MKGLFVTGTDTDVGKTWISCLITRQLLASGHRVGVYKPACSGSSVDSAGTEYWPDLRALLEAVGGEVPLDRVCPQRFAEPLAPPVAAQRAGATVNSQRLRNGVDWWRENCDVLIVEGVGGLLCPMTDTETIADLAVDLGFPLLLVARPNLGTINHSLLTLDVCRTHKLNVSGVVLNQASDDVVASEFVASNAEQIQRFGKVPVLGYCEFATETLRDPKTGEPIATDWFSLAACAE